jgi:hypothetical protein
MVFRITEQKISVMFPCVVWKAEQVGGLSQLAGGG